LIIVSMWFLVAQRIFFDFLWHILYFPLWWYSGGIAYVGRRCISFVQMGNFSLAPGLWLKNIFVPIYGADDWEGRIISFFLRLVNVIARSVLLFIWIIVALFLCIVWAILPIFFVYMLVRTAWYAV